MERKGEKTDEDEKSFKSSMDRAWISLSGTWYVLYGNAVLLCQEFKETA